MIRRLRTALALDATSARQTLAHLLPRWVCVILCPFLILGCKADSTDMKRNRSLNERCHELLVLELEQDRKDEHQRQSAIMSDFETFYSEKFHTCIATQVNVMTSSFHVRDLTKNFLKDFPTFFQCDADMHFEANLERVKGFEGWVANVPYDDWGITDDRSGSGKVKLSKQECASRFESMLERLAQ